MHRNIKKNCGELHFSALLSRLRRNHSSLWLHFHTCLLKMGFPGFFQHFFLKDLILYFSIQSESEYYLDSSVLSLTALSLTNSCYWDFKWCDFDWQCYLWCCQWCWWRWRCSWRLILTSYKQKSTPGSVLPLATCLLDRLPNTLLSLLSLDCLCWEKSCASDT